MRAAFERDLAASRPITLEAWQRRPLDDARQGNCSRDSGSTGCDGIAMLDLASLRAACARACRAALARPARGAAGAGRRRRCSARHAALQDKFANNQFGRPLVLESTETLGDLKGDVYAVVDHPFAMVAAGAASRPITGATS